MTEVHYEFRPVDDVIHIYCNGKYLFTANSQEEAIQGIIRRDKEENE